MLRVAILLVSIAFGAAPAVAKEKAAPTSPLVTALGTCQRVADGPARLACYDRAAPALVGAANSGDIRIVDRESVQKARRSLFGFSVPSFAFLGASSSKEEETAKRLDSTITTFRSTGNGFYRFAIAEDGAVWESTESASIRDAKPGEPVTISRSGLGGFWAKIGNRREIRVRRIR